MKIYQGFSGGIVVKNPPTNAGEPDSIFGSGRSPGVENGNPLQCSCLENSIDRGAWQATVRGVAKSQTRVSEHKHMEASLVSGLFPIPSPSGPQLFWDIVDM